MVQRLATKLKARFRLTEAERQAFLSLLSEHEELRKAASVRVLENGEEEVCLESGRCGSVTLTFRRENGEYVCDGTCDVRDPNVARALGRAIAMFRADARMHRIYPSSVVTYEYERGAVKRIVERTGGSTRLIYERKEESGRLQRLFRDTTVERKIGDVMRRIDALLDQRNATPDRHARRAIDDRLRRLVEELFRLEA